MIEARLLPGLPDPEHERRDAAAHANQTEDQLLSQHVRDADDDPRDERQLGAEARVEVGERRHDAEDDDRDQDDGER